MSAGEGTTPPILADKHHDASSAFTPESLLREARRQKGADAVAVPKVCLLDPDGDIVRQLRANGRAQRRERGPPAGGGRVRPVDFRQGFHSSQRQC